MLGRYRLNGDDVDSLELKALVVTRGVNISPLVFERFSGSHRVSPPGDPTACDCFLLPDGSVVHAANVGERSPFALGVGEDGKPVLKYAGRDLTQVELPPATAFYEQRTSSGVPFKGTAVLQGLDVLSFFYLWPCDYAKAGFACQFCNAGGYTQALAAAGKALSPSPSARDVAEIVDYAVNREPVASYVQITGGSSMDSKAEVGKVVEMLREIDRVAGLGNVEGEILVYTSPPADPAIIADVFDAGADRVACDIEVWNPNYAARITPGKWRFAGRERQLATLEFIAERYGPNRACSAFVVGVEPADSFLEGARYLGERGIVPIASVWLPHGRPVDGSTEAPGLDFYRKVIDGLAEIYDRYGCEPPGDAGFNVCLCRDTWRHRRKRRRCSCSGSGSPGAGQSW